MAISKFKGRYYDKISTFASAVPTYTSVWESFSSFGDGQARESFAYLSFTGIIHDRIIY